jgi:hypothetical protein
MLACGKCRSGPKRPGDRTDPSQRLDAECSWCYDTREHASRRARGLHRPRRSQGGYRAAEDSVQHPLTFLQATVGHAACRSTVLRDDARVQPDREGLRLPRVLRPHHAGRKWVVRNGTAPPHSCAPFTRRPIGNCVATWRSVAIVSQQVRYMLHTSPYTGPAFLKAGIPKFDQPVDPEIW